MLRAIKSTYSRWFTLFKAVCFWLVKEVGSERAIVHQLAPHLVLPEKMLPLIEGGSYGKWLTSIGLKVYDILAQVEGEDKDKC